ncbi:M23 family metallopeptidase [Thiolinea disciformis]|uniref:M23 family metallopeptidase n=1 Tax=Thiolinea disciformis TaxID=125614 RepID=UPI000477637E|nr:M23 family metallopeptidase [Thiolinea disciformis]
MKKIILFLMSIVALGFLLPESVRIPVQGATPADWNPRSFWYYPWGRSGAHKGIDIFAKQGTPVIAAASGLVLNADYDEMGGNFVWILSAHWRVHYYAHLQQSTVSAGQIVKSGQALGTVGSTGNASGKAPHLHYAIRSLFPLLRQLDRTAPQAWHKMFFVNPDPLLRKASVNHE